jgi:hypothetical protein
MKMAKRKFVIRDIQTVLRSFSERTREQSGSYSYSSGYLESMVAQLLADAPRHKQVECLSLLMSANFKEVK